MSAVGLNQISAANEDEKATTVVTEKPTYDTSKKITEQKAETSIVARIGMGAGKVVATFQPGLLVKPSKQCSTRSFLSWPLFPC